MLIALDRFINTLSALSGSIKSEDFYPMSEDKRKLLRNKFGIKDDEKVIIYLGRNQLRKIFSSHMEALVKFKKKNPDKKLKLLFHTKFNEPGGWPIEQIRKELELKEEDILCSYFCKNCGDWFVKEYKGDDKDCGVCGGKNTVSTAGVDSTITEKDLNKIYNIADGSASIFTSGGLEYTNVESLLSGIPLACPNYSCGEEFCENDFVYKIKGGFTREHNSGFKKFVPNIDSIVEFYEKIHSMTEKEKQKIIKEGREWALNKFDANKVANKILDIIKNFKKIDWDSFEKKRKELKNPNAQINHNQDDLSWLKDLYKEVLKMNVKDDDSGLSFWLDELKNKKRTRQEIDNYFRNEAHKENLSKNQQPFETLLINNGKKNLLLVCPESGGDILYASCVLESLRKSYKKENWNIYFACKNNFFELLDGNENIDKVIPYFSFMESEINCTGQGNNKGYFDAYIFLTVGTQRFLNYLTANEIAIDLK